MSSVHNLAQVDLNLLLVLDDLLQSHSTTASARRLGRTQSAVSHALARLRDTFGDPLFVRAGSVLQPTAIADQLRAPLRELLLQAQALVEKRVGAFDPSLVERTFVLACADQAEVTILPRLLPRLRREAPGIDIVARMYGDDFDRAAQAREVDLAFGTTFRALSGLVETKVGEEAMVVLLRRGHPALARRLTPRRYAELDHVLVMPRGNPGGSVDLALEPLGLKRRVVLRLPHFAAAAMIVARTDFVVTLPESIARELGEPLALVARPAPIALPPVRYAIGYSSAFENDPAHRWFREAFLAAARGK